MAKETLATCQRVLPADDRLILDATLAYAVAAQSLEGWRLAMEARIRFDGPDSDSAHFGMHVYGTSLAGQGGRPKEGRVYQERALDYFRRHPEETNRIDSYENCVRQFLNWTYCTLGMFEEAEAVLDPIIPILERFRRGEEPIWLYPAQSFWFQAQAIAGQGRLGEAESMLRSDLKLVQEALGEEHWVALGMSHDLADILRETGRINEALEIALDDSRFADRITDDKPDCRLASLRARVLLDAGHSERAVIQVGHALDQLDQLKGSVKQATRLDIAEVVCALGGIAEASKQLESAMEFYDVRCEPIHPFRARTRRLAGAILVEQGEPGRAETFLREALALDLEFRGPDHRETAKSRLALGRLLASTGRIEEARIEFEEADRIFRSSPFEEGLWLPRVQAVIDSL